MTRALLLALALALTLALPGCLRVGPGEDLHLVCEEKSGSPRMAYGVEDLLARTTVNGSLDGPSRVRILDAARHHVITVRGAPYATFDATLSSTTPTAWRFLGVGSWEDAEPDVYDVTIEDVGGRTPVPDVVDAPRTIRDAAWRMANESGEEIPTLGRATWDAGLPSCVALFHDGGSLVVNVVQGRIVAK